MEQEQNNTTDSYVYHIPSSTYDYPNKPYEPFAQPKSPKPEKKHKCKRILSIVIGFLILILGLFLSYQYIPSVKRIVYKTFCSTETYYYYIESENIKQTVTSINEMAKKTGQSLTDYRTSTPMQGSIDISLNPTADNIVSKPHNLTLSYSYEPGEDGSRTSMHLTSDNSELLDVDYLENGQKQYLYFPQIDTTYLDITGVLQAIAAMPQNLTITGDPASSSFTSSYLNNQELFTNMSSVFNEDTLTTLFERYGKILSKELSQYSNVTLEEDVSLNLADYMGDSIEEDDVLPLTCERFEVSITRNDAITIAQNLLTQFKTDDVIVSLVEAAGIDKTYFNILLGYLSVALETYKIDSEEPAITMDVYMSNGKVALRKVKFADLHDFEFIYASQFSEPTNYIYLSCGSNTLAEDATVLRLLYHFSPYEGTGNAFPKDEPKSISCMEREQLKQYLENSSIGAILETFSSTFAINIDNADFKEGILSFMDDTIYNALD